VRRSSAAIDDYGQPVYTTASTDMQASVSARVTGTNFEPDQIVVTAGLTLYFPYGSDLQDDDTFIIRGKSYQTDGEAFDWKSGLGTWSPGTVLNVKREAERG
jgi:hypothetical protein